MPGAYKYSKLVDLITLIGSTKINVYGIVKDFTVVYKQDAQIFKFELYDDTLLDGHSVDFSLTVRSEEYKLLDGFIGRNMLLRVHRCLCRNRSNNRLELHGTLSEAGLHIIGYSLSLYPDDLLHPHFLSSKTFTIEQIDKTKVNQLYNFWKINSVGPIFDSIQLHSESNKLCYRQTAEISDNNYNQETNNVSDGNLRQIVIEQPDIEADQNGDTTTAGTSNKENHLETSFDQAAERNSLNLSDYDPSGSIENVKQAMNKLRLKENSNLKDIKRFCDISDEDDGRYFDLICQVVNVCVPRPNQAAKKPVSLKVWDGTQIPTQLNPIQLNDDEYEAASQSLFENPFIDPYVYGISCFGSYGDVAKKLNAGDYVKIMNMKYQRKPAMFTLTLHEYAGQKYQRGVKKLVMD